MLRLSLFSTIALTLAQLLPSAARAQETVADGPGDTTSIGTGASDTSDEIIVTARRRQESAQNIPIAVSVFGSDHIDYTGSFNVGRLTQLTPTLQFYSSNPASATGTSAMT